MEKVWNDPVLVLSQTCGLPYRTRLHGKVGLVGTPDYGLPGCAAEYYSSVIVVRKDDPRTALGAFGNARMACNTVGSQSDFAALYAHLARGGNWIADRQCSGSHVASARMVAQHSADIAAIDAQTWRYITRFDPWAEKLRVLDRTAPTPGTLHPQPAKDTNAVFDAVSEAIAGLSHSDADALCLRGIVRIPAEAYLAVSTPPASAFQALRRQAM